MGTGRSCLRPDRYTSIFYACFSQSESQSLTTFLPVLASTTGGNHFYICFLFLPCVFPWRQVIARVVEGSFDSLESLSAGLLQHASNQPAVAGDCVTLIERAIGMVGEQADARPDCALGQPFGVFVRNWKVGDPPVV